MSIPFNYHHLFYFYTAARLGSVSAAAKELRVSQPALSAQIKRLEEMLGRKLLEKSGRRLVPTEDGRFALEHAETIFNAGRELLDGLSDRGPGFVRLQLGLSDSIPKSFADGFLRRLLRAEPRLHLTVFEGRPDALIAELEQHALDMVLSDVPAKADSAGGIHNRLVAEFPVLFYAHPRLAARYRSLPQSLDGAPVLLPTAHSQIFHSIKDYFAANGVTPRVVAEIQDVELVLRLAAAGEGLAPLSAALLESPHARRLRVLGDRKKPVAQDRIYWVSKKRTAPHPLEPQILSALQLGLK